MRLIDADELKKQFEDRTLEDFTCFHFIEAIDNAPTIEERQQGTWEQIRRFNKKGRIFLNCNQCNYGKNGEIICELPEIPKFCPNCGAKMEGAEE